jgi:hypothetical protein
VNRSPTWHRSHAAKTLTMASATSHPYGQPSPDPRERKLANAILDRAAFYHRPGHGLKGLYGVDDVGPFRGAPCGYPSLVGSFREDWKPQSQTDREVRNYIFKAMRMRDPVEFDFDAHGMFIAGGVVANAFYKNHRGAPNCDIDIFLVGHTAVTAEQAISALASRLSSVHEGRQLVVFRSPYCVTFKATTAGRKSFLYQVILKLYENHGQVLHSFDLGPSAVGLYRGRLVLTELAKYAAETGLILLNLAARRRTLEARLAKYVNEKGFGIGFPDLLMLPDLNTLLHSEGRISFAHLEMVYDVNAQDEDDCTCSLFIKWVDVITPVSRHAEDRSVDSIYGHDSKVYTEGDDYFLAHLLGLHDKQAVTLSRAQYAPGMDILGLQTRLELTDVFKMALARAKLDNWYTRFVLKERTPIWCCVEAVLDYLPKESNIVRTPNFTKIQVILGADFTSQLMRYYDRKTPVDPYEALELLERLCAARIASVQLHMPPSVPDSVVQGGEIVTFPLCPLTPAEWFGSAHALAADA